MSLIIFTRSSFTSFLFLHFSVVYLCRLYFSLICSCFLFLSNFFQIPFSVFSFVCLLGSLGLISSFLTLFGLSLVSFLVCLSRIFLGLSVSFLSLVFLFFNVPVYVFFLSFLLPMFLSFSLSFFLAPFIGSKSAEESFSYYWVTICARFQSNICMTRREKFLINKLNIFTNFKFLKLKWKWHENTDDSISMPSNIFHFTYQPINHCIDNSYSPRFHDL